MPLELSGGASCTSYASNVRSQACSKSGDKSVCVANAFLKILTRLEKQQAWRCACHVISLLPIHVLSQVLIMLNLTHHFVHMNR